MIKQVDWYFDFISPYAYIQYKCFHLLPKDLDVTMYPVLFAGLLNHWDHKGPAEIPEKRFQTYRHAEWLGNKLGIRLETPPKHPFNPIRPLRLAIALGANERTVGEIFDFIWAQGKDCQDDKEFQTLSESLGIRNIEELISNPEVKSKLRENTDKAITQGVYGVPTFVARGNLFWGHDNTEMFIEYIRNPDLMDAPNISRLRDLPTGASR